MASILFLHYQRYVLRDLCPPEFLPHERRARGLYLAASRRFTNRSMRSAVACRKLKQEWRQKWPNGSLSVPGGTESRLSKPGRAMCFVGPFGSREFAGAPVDSGASVVISQAGHLGTPAGVESSIGASSDRRGPSRAGAPDGEVDYGEMAFPLHSRICPLPTAALCWDPPPRYETPEG